MKCLVCHGGELVAGKRSVTFERNGDVLVVAGVPGIICDVCGEGYFDGRVTQRVIDIAEGERRRGVRFGLIDYGAICRL
jgi:YgiT-type zinc finger domain-containing protein